MSATIKYKGNTIASINTNTTKIIKTSGKYCEGDISVENVQDGGITPSGTTTITTNGTHDVTNFANANVNVPTSNSINIELTLESDVTGTVKIISNNTTIASHYADDNAVCTITPTFDASGNQHVICYTSMNRTVGSMSSLCLITGSTGSAAIVAQQGNFKNTITAGLHLYGDSSGNIYIVCAARYLVAGTYHITFSW